MAKHFKVTKQPPSPAQQFALLREEVYKSEQRIADKQVELLEAVPANRNGRFKFKGVAAPRGPIISSIVILENESESLGRYGGTVGELWDWLNKGTPAHEIKPRFKKALRFVVAGAVRFARLVNHPGTKAQNITRRINRAMQPFRKKETDKGFKAAWKSLEKFNRK